MTGVNSFTMLGNYRPGAVGEIVCTKPVTLGFANLSALHVSSMAIESCGRSNSSDKSNS